MCTWAHIEPRRGSQCQAIDYCSKSESRVHGPDTSIQYGQKHESTGSRGNPDSPFKRAMLENTWQEGFALLKEQAPRDFIIYHSTIKRSLKAIFDKPVTLTRFSPDSFTIPLLQDVLLEKALILSGISGAGKTQFAIAHFNNPLIVSHVEDLKKLETSGEPFDGIIFDDMDFSHWPPNSCIHLVDLDLARSIHVRYGTVTIPAKTKKIFTTNKTLNGIMSEKCSPEEFAAINRRCYVLEFNEPLFTH